MTPTINQCLAHGKQFALKQAEKAEAVLAFPGGDEARCRQAIYLGYDLQRYSKADNPAQVSLDCMSPDDYSAFFHSWLQEVYDVPALRLLVEEKLK